MAGTISKESAERLVPCLTGYADYKQAPEGYRKAKLWIDALMDNDDSDGKHPKSKELLQHAPCSLTQGQAHAVNQELKRIKKFTYDDNGTEKSFWELVSTQFNINNDSNVHDVLVKVAELARKYEKKTPEEIAELQEVTDLIDQSPVWGASY